MYVMMVKCRVQYTFTLEQSYDFQTDVFFRFDVDVFVIDDDVGDPFHHAAGVCPQLVHGDGSAHQLGQAGLQGDQVARNLNTWERTSFSQRASSRSTCATNCNGCCFA